MSERNKKIIEFFKYIRGAANAKTIEELKNCCIYACLYKNEEDDYLKSLMIQLLCVTYVRYYELFGNDNDRLHITSHDLVEDDDYETVITLTPNYIIDLYYSVYSEASDKVKTKLDFVLNQFGRVPCFMKYFYDHKELLDTYVKDPTSKEEVEESFKTNKEYSSYFYLLMMEIYNPYSYEDQKDVPTTYVREKDLEVINEIESVIDDIAKGKYNIDISKLVTNLLFIHLYRYDDKEISRKAYFIFEKMLRNNLIDNKGKGIFINSSVIPVLDINLLKVIIDFIITYHAEDKSLVNDIVTSYLKLENDYKDFKEKEESKLLNETQINNDVKPTVKKEENASKPNQVSKPIKWGLLAFIAFIQLALCAYIWNALETSLSDIELRNQILDFMNNIIVKIDSSLVISSLDIETIMYYSNGFLMAGACTLVIFVLFILLSKVIKPNSKLGKVIIFIISLLYGIAKLPLSTLIASNFISKRKEYLPFKSWFVRFLISLIPIAVFFLSIRFL